MILERIDLYWEDLNTPTGNPTIDKAHKEIIDLSPVIGFALSSLILMMVAVQGLGIADKGGSGFIFFAETIIFAGWCLIYLHYKKKRV